MKKTLLQIVNDVLSSIDGEKVSTIDQTVESQQIVDIVESVYDTFFLSDDLPEHRRLFKLISESDNTKPVYMRVPDDIRRIYSIWYDKESDLTKPRNYQEVQYLPPLDFLELTDRTSENFMIVPDPNAATDLRIRTDKPPDYYTSFDDKILVFDSFDKSVGDTLKESRIRAYGLRTPAFVRDDDFVPELDINMFPALINEAKSLASEQLKGVALRKVEQYARHSRHSTKNDHYTVGRNSLWANYGRRV